MILKYYLITMGVLAGAFGMSVQPAAAVNWGNCSVEQGLTTITATTTTAIVIPTNTINDVDQAFVLAQATGDAAIRQTDDHFVTGEIDPSTGAVIFTRTGTTGDAQVSYQIVECEDGDKIQVQRGTIALGSGATSATGALTSSVDTSRSLVLATIRSNAGSTSDAGSMVTAALQDASTVVVQRATAAPSTLRVHYQVIEFTAASNVQLQTAETTLSSGVASATVTLTTAAATDRSWVYCTYDAIDNGLQQTTVACELTDASTVTLYRSAASSYTNRVRVYVVTWPGNTVTVQSGTDAFDSTAADNTAVDHTITLSTAITDQLSFPYVTNTTTGTATEYPRNRWLSGLPTSTSLLLRFYRSDPSGDSDATVFYWQIINFPPPYEASGWGWIGNSTTAADGTVLISFSCDSITVDTTWTDCGDGSSGTRYDYGVQLERGGCGDTCDVSGQAWVGDYTTGETAPHTIGMIDFDTDVTSGPPVTLGDDVNTPEDDTLDAHWNEETGEVYGWARFRALEEYEDNLGGTANDWGWIKLRGTESSGGTEYGVSFDTDALEFSGWSWNDNGSDPSTGLEEDGSGFGWVKFDLDTSGTVAAAWLRTTQADVYSQQGFNLNTNAPTGEYSATYLIISGGDATTINNFDTQLGTTITDEDLGGIPTDNAAQVYRGTLGSLYLNELIDQADQTDTDGTCDDTLFTGATNPLGGDIFYCDGDLTISNNLTFYNATGSDLGNGTVIVTGDLVIEDNLNYFNTTIDQHINNLASIAWIVQGSVLIDPIVTQVVGAFIVLGDSDATTTGDCHFTTGNSTLPLEVQGLVMACAFDLERQSLGSTPDPEPGEDFRYDGRVFANPPPGLDDFASLIPEFVL